VRRKINRIIRSLYYKLTNLRKVASVCTCCDDRVSLIYCCISRSQICNERKETDLLLVKSVGLMVYVQANTAVAYFILQKCIYNDEVRSLMLVLCGYSCHERVRWIMTVRWEARQLAQAAVA
jgi:hypothetical protein